MINQRLKQLRAENNLTQTNLADILGIAKTTLAAYEQGKSEPSIDTIIKLADFFNVSIDYLLGRTNIKSPNVEISYIANYLGLSEKSIANLANLNSKSPIQLTFIQTNNYERKPIGALDFILSQDNIEDFVISLFDYFTSYVNKNVYLYIDNGELKLTNTPTTQPQLPLSSDYLPQIILLEIENFIKKYREEYRCISFESPTTE